MLGTLPQSVDLARAVPRHEEFKGTVPLAVLSRLSRELAAADGQAQVQLSVERAPPARVRIHGEVRAVLTLTCQRCLGPVQLPVTAEPDLVWVRSDAEAAELDAALEPLLSETGHVQLAGLVEDELLLALPAAVTHADEQACGMPVQVAADNGSRARHPFAALTALKRSR